MLLYNDLGASIECVSSVPRAFELIFRVRCETFFKTWNGFSDITELDPPIVNHYY
jgi:hypothetical protein